MRERQRELAGSAAVLEGRDTGTRVCPEADLKIYLTAPVAVRAAPARPAARAAGRGGGAGDRGARPAGRAADAARARRTPDRYRRHGCRRSRGRSCWRWPGSGRRDRGRAPYLAAPADLPEGAGAAPPAPGRARPRARAALGAAAAGLQSRVLLGHPAARLVQPRDLRFMAKSELFRFPLFGWLHARAAGRSRCAAASPTGKRFGSCTTRSAAATWWRSSCRATARRSWPAPRPAPAVARWSRKTPVVPVAISGTGSWRPGRRTHVVLRRAAQLRAVASGGRPRPTGRPPTS